MSEPIIEMTADIPRADMVRTLAALGPQGFLDLVKDVDEEISDWEFVRLLGVWVDEETRKMVEERNDLQAQTHPSTRTSVR